MVVGAGRRRSARSASRLGTMPLLAFLLLCSGVAGVPPAVVVEEDVMELRVDPLVEPWPPVGAAEALRMAQAPCPTCQTVRGCRCIASKRIVLRLQLDGARVTSLLTPAQVGVLHTLTWRLQVESAELAPHEQHARSRFRRDLPLSESHDLNFGEGIQNGRLWSVVGELVTPFKAPGGGGAVYVFRGRTRFCVARSHAEYMEVGTPRCPAAATAVAAAAAAAAAAPLRLPPEQSPPTAMPAALCARYTRGGAIPVSTLYYDDKTDPDKSYQARSRAHIDGLVERARRREAFYYNMTDVWMFAALDRHPVAGLDVLIIGSNVPWYEAICVARGARSCTTLEYNELRYDHPRLRTVTVADFEGSRELPDGQLRRWDVAWSISSFEHDGLGRYGDDLNPDADLQAMERVRGYVREAGVGKLFLSLPVGRDEVVWNAQRVYGPLRLPLLLAGWETLGVFGHERADFERREFGHEPVFVLTPVPRAAVHAAVAVGTDGGQQRPLLQAELAELAELQLQSAMLDKRIEELLQRTSL